MSTYGFIITRHVNSETTNKYWNQCIKLIRTFYPLHKIVLIDDNSDHCFIKADHEYSNITYFQSKYPGRGELLPYIYYLKYKWFPSAVIIHDSVFIHSRINFEKLINENVKVIPLWFFYPDKEDLDNRLRIASNLKHSYSIINQLNLNDNVLGMPHLKWYGCFGVQCFINRDFLLHLQNKYSITNLIDSVHNRKDRQCRLCRRQLHA